MAKSWYAVYTKAKKEYGVAQLLSNAGMEVLSPRLKLKKSHRGKRIEIIEPLFPCYIFAQFDYPHDYRLVKYTRGVRRVVGTSREPLPVDDWIISMIKARLVDGIVELKPPVFKRGDVVEVTDGPFQGLMGIFEREIPGKQRALLLLDTIMQARVEVDKGDIIKAC